ncbi:hypothetical protein JKF63_01660 [Porcisia hertigi]|uniref:Uncharacterized protein n=1 Tax=Porcisia hertigi TaxID=2761500 RepID=A0A836IG65_9TRYP|nr:hypothetical protein JKF63_01660 [Porcisia hertigi]
MGASATSPPPPLLSTPNRLSYIASYWPSVAHWSGSDWECHQQRLPLAWISASPAARLVAEQRHAWAVLPFTHIEARPSKAEADGASKSRVENIFGVTLANATVQPRVLQTALETSSAKRCATGCILASSQQITRGSRDGSALSWCRWAVERLADVGHAASPAKCASVAFNSSPSTSLREANGGSSAARGATDVANAARSCGVHIGGLTVVLVSGAHELDAGGAETASPRDGTSSHGVVKREDTLPTGPRGDMTALGPQFLFPSTTSCGGSVASMLSVPPNAAMYRSIDEFLKEEHMPSSTASIFRSGAQLHGDDGGAEDETSHDPKTATSVYVVQQLAELRHQTREAKLRRVSSAPVSSPELFLTVWYRQVFVSTAEATSEVLCGVSQWWLQRPIRRDELTTTAQEALRFTHRKPSAGDSGSCADPPALPPPSLHIKYVSDVFTDFWWPHRLTTAVQHRLVGLTSHLSWVMKSLLQVWMMLVAFVQTALHGVSTTTPPSDASNVRHDGPSHRQSVPPVDLVSAFYKMGKTYGKHQMAALDVSHTGVRGVHLLACAIGSVTTSIMAKDGQSSVLHREGLRALDVAGCLQLHHRRGELDTLSHMLNQLYIHAASEVAVGSLSKPSDTLAVVDLLLCLCLQDGVSLSRQSAAGLALGLFTHHGHLTWVCGAGSDMDNAALRELGQYALLVEAVVATQHPEPRHAPTCTLRALDLTSALRVDDVNPLGYLTRLEQLLLPFTYVDDVGIRGLDGHTYARDLSAFLSLCSTAKANELTDLSSNAKETLQSTLDALQHLTTTMPGEGTAQANGNSKKPCNGVVEALQQRFCNHLYHLDFTYCLGVSNVKGLACQQRLELLNLSQTRVGKIGLFGGDDHPRCTPPLRLFIAEMCEYLSDLSGLAHMNTLECVVVRSGSLGDDGLRSMCTPALQRLQLVDLSYCDRLHHVGCLVKLPALKTLILDSTDVTPAEVKELRSSRSLHTLSLRFCSDFACIGEDLRELEAVVGTFSALKRYIYEDLAGDDELRKK